MKTKKQGRDDMKRNNDTRKIQALPAPRDKRTGWQASHELVYDADGGPAGWREPFRWGKHGPSECR